jgi:multidrug resistance efflux pump
LVPTDDRLIVELLVRPNDIDRVTLGQRARIRLTSFRQNAPPLLPGHVVTIAPDVQATGADHQGYPVRVVLDPEALALVPQQSLAAGMPVEAFLLGKGWTPLDYFWEPIRGSARRPVLPPAPEADAE